MILKQLLREEWRIHSTIFGNKNFAFFPIIILTLCAGFALISPIFLGEQRVYDLTHYLFLAFGVAIGSFGLAGREVFNKRFGETSYLAYSSRILPVSVRKMFLNFALKDLIYYTSFFIIPFCAAFILSSFFTGITIEKSIAMLITLPLSFFIGLGASFFLSTIYSILRIPTQIFLIGIVVYVFLNLGYFAQETAYQTILPSLKYFNQGKLTDLITSIALPSILFAVSAFLFSFDYISKNKGYKTMFKAADKPAQTKAFMLKDLLDLERSQGGFGKIIFSFIIPILIVEVMISFVLNVFSISSEGLLVLTSVVIGVTASTVYNWLSEFDDAKKYLSHPISAKTVCLSKSLLTIIIGGATGIGVLILSFLFTEASITSLIISFAVFTASFTTTLSVLVFLTGLNPGLLLFNAKTFLKYLTMLGPVIVLFMLESFAYSKTLLITTSIISIAISAPMLKKGVKKAVILE